MSNVSFKIKLQVLINQYSLENNSNTPDYILAGYIENCLHAFNEATQQREEAIGRERETGREYRASAEVDSDTGHGGQ